MANDLHVRQPGGSLPEAVRDAAVRAGRRRGSPVDPLVLERVRDALARSPDVLRPPVESGAPPSLDGPAATSSRLRPGRQGTGSLRRSHAPGGTR
jgi:hypothetical protein